ncbi:DUF2130 domain-containing protein [Candidatus Thioglobus sp.]|nr:DUF2130 domain-containing protein [Candidatus Thioglobus sp.]
MENNTINCPHCNGEINVKSALQNQVSGEVNAQYKDKYAARDEMLEKKAAELFARENAIKEQEQNNKSQDDLIDSKVQEELKKLMPNLEQEVGSKFAPILEEAAEMKKAILAYQQKEIKDKRDEATRQDELALRDEKIRAEQAERMRADFEKQREADKAAHDRALELQKLEGEEKVKQMKNSLEKGLSQANQVPQQIQGEAGENIVENHLINAYPFDTLEPIKTGAKGADCLLKVSDNGRDTKRSIYIEVKRHKDFKQAWIPKFKNDIREINADIGVIATEVMPKGISKPVCIDGIWVASLTDYDFVIDCLRHNLIELSRLEIVNENALDKQSLVYQFVTSKEFARILDELYERYKEELTSLDYEERLMNKSWGKRRKNLELIKKTTGSFIGAFQAYSGNAISEIKALEVSEV